jgi:hypothetical protein
MNLFSFNQALKISSMNRRHVLLGNGFSRAWKDDIFAYSALFDRADFSKLSPKAKKAFSTLETTDFEVVMRALRDAAKLLAIYQPSSPVGDALMQDAEGLREVLARAIADSHPERPKDISDASYIACRHFLSNFICIYSLNYDLLLYWAMMQTELESRSAKIKCDDGFRTPDYGEQEYVTWDIEKTDGQNIFYLHGALHIFDAGAELQKFTWTNTGVALIDQIRDALANNLFPLVVAEGSGEKKLEKIMHSNYLSRGYRSFASIGGALFLYGLSLGDSDDHIMRLLSSHKCKVSKLFVSIFGDPESKENKKVVDRALKIVSAKHVDVFFYDAATAKVWG